MAEFWESWHYEKARERGRCGCGWRLYPGVWKCPYCGHIPESPSIPSKVLEYQVAARRGFCLTLSPGRFAG